MEVEELAEAGVAAAVTVERIRALAAGFGLVPIGRAGERTPFDPARHAPIGGPVAGRVGGLDHPAGLYLASRRPGCTHREGAGRACLTSQSVTLDRRIDGGRRGGGRLVAEVEAAVEGRGRLRHGHHAASPTGRRRAPAAIVPLGTVDDLAAVGGAAGRRPACEVGEDAEHGPPEQVIRSVKRAITQRRETIVVGAADGRRRPRHRRASLAEVADRAARAGLALPVAGASACGCPAMWDGPQRRRLLDARRRAGLPVAGRPGRRAGRGRAGLAHPPLPRARRTADRPAARLRPGRRHPRRRGARRWRRSDAGGHRARRAWAWPWPVTRSTSRSPATWPPRWPAHGIDPDRHPQPDLAWALLERAAREAKVRLSTVGRAPGRAAPRRSATRTSSGTAGSGSRRRSRPSSTGPRTWPSRPCGRPGWPGGAGDAGRRCGPSAGTSSPPTSTTCCWSAG